MPCEIPCRVVYHMRSDGGENAMCAERELRPATSTDLYGPLVPTAGTRREATYYDSYILRIAIFGLKQWFKS